jgi:hypothetical protein
MVTTNPITFWAHAVKGPDPDDCWIWQGKRTRSGGRYGKGGYGHYNGRNAHRIAYELKVGPIPEGLTIDHLCGVPACVNPAHLEPVTQLENTRRYYVQITECGNGHAFNEDNTHIRPDGTRRCRACNRDAVARYKARRAAA